MRILIVGAGIAGLVLGLLLKQRGLQPVLVENKPPGSPYSGFAIGLWPLGSCVLKGLGLYSQFEEISLPLRRFRVATWEDKILQSYPVEYMGNTYGMIRMVKRGELARLLMSEAADMIRYQKTITSIRQNTNVVLVDFSDGERLEVDVLLGCDGVHSKVRERVFNPLEPQRLGWTGWGWWADKYLAPEDEMTEYWQPGKSFCAVYPARHATCVFIGVADKQFNGEGPLTLNAVKAKLCGVNGAVNRLLNSIPVNSDIPNNKIFQGPFYSIRMPSWHERRVALVGDSASAYFPFGGLGIGASMAMESAAVLADELTRTDARLIPRALQFYQKRRQARIKRVEAAVNTVVSKFLVSDNEETGFSHVIESQRSNFHVFKELLEQPV